MLLGSVLSGQLYAAVVLALLFASTKHLTFLRIFSPLSAFPNLKPRYFKALPLTQQLCA